MPEIVGYTYRADLFCPPCIVLEYDQAATAVALRKNPSLTPEGLLDKFAGIQLINREDETTFDSDDFPKVVLREHLTCTYRNGYAVADEHDRCARCAATLCGAPSTIPDPADRASERVGADLD